MTYHPGPNHSNLSPSPGTTSNELKLDFSAPDEEFYAAQSSNQNHSYGSTYLAPAAINSHENSVHNAYPNYGDYRSDPQPTQSFTHTGNPLYTHDSQSSQGAVFTSRKAAGNNWESGRSIIDYNEPKKTKASLAEYIMVMWIDRDAKNLLLYIVVVFLFTLIQIVYGTKEESLGLVAKAFHTLFDCITMMISLAAIVVSRLEPSKRYSFGYDRLEILLGFASGAFLLFVSLFLFKESIERLLEPIEEHSQGSIIPMAFVGLLLNAGGVVFFHHHMQTRAEIRTRTRKDNISLVSRLLTDVLGSLLVIISTWLAQWNDIQVADTFAAMIIAMMICYIAVPICQRTGKVLLQTTPEAIRHGITKCLSEASTYEGVLECTNTHFWTQAPGVFVGTLCVRVRSDANEQVVLQQITRLFLPLITHLTIQVEKDNWVLSS